MLPKMSKYLVLKEYLTGTKNVYDKMISSIDNNKIELEQLRKDLDVKTIEQSKLKLNIVEIENNLNILNIDILQIKSDIDVIEKDKIEYNTLLNEIQLLENELLQVKIELEKANNNLQVARQNFKNIESKKQLQEEQLLKNIEKSEKLIEEYKTELNVLDEKLTQDIEKSKIQNERLKEQIKLEIEETKSWLKQVIEFLESLDVKLDTILNEYKTKVEKIEKEANDILKNKIFDGSEYSESIEKLKNSIEFEKSKYEEEYQKYIRLDSIRKILTAKFNIKNFLMEKFRPYLNKQISNYISIFRVPATIMFDENFELQLKGNDYDELSLKSLSAGEICKTSLAILLASMKVKREVFQNNEFMLMILDEVLTNVDKESLNEILSIMKNNFEDEYFIGIVQHNIDSECEANVIEITKNNKEGSKIKIL
jgi:DNA repair exonuclease SbcCD ATPase subunit